MTATNARNIQSGYDLRCLYQSSVEISKNHKIKAGSLHTDGRFCGFFSLWPYTKVRLVIVKGVGPGVLSQDWHRNI